MIFHENYGKIESIRDCFSNFIEIFGIHEKLIHPTLFE